VCTRVKTSQFYPQTPIKDYPSKAVHTRTANLTYFVRPFKRIYFRILSYISLESRFDRIGTVEYGMNYCNPLIFLPKSAEAYLVGAADYLAAVGVPAEISAKFVKIRVWEQFFAFYLSGYPTKRQHAM